MKYIALMIALIILAGCIPQAQAAAPTGTPTATNTTQPTSTVTRQATPTPAYPATCTVSGTGGMRLNVRTAPSKQADITSSLPPGETVTVTGLSGDWYETSHNNRAGYVARIYCR